MVLSDATLLAIEFVKVVLFAATLNTKFANYYTAITSDARYQMALTATSPLSITSNILSTDLSNYSTLANFSTAVANLVSSAPATLDTLKELETALSKRP